MNNRKRIGIFGWGLVAPKSPNIEIFEQNLTHARPWLEPFEDFGPNNFLVGKPDFRFRDYKPWIDAHFEPRKFSQLDSKMGNATKYAIGAFIQALAKNEGLETALSDLGPQAHIYVGTGLGDIPVQYQASVAYYKAQRRWNRFWCRPANHDKLADYYACDEVSRASIRAAMNVPLDPVGLDSEDSDYEDVVEAWERFWVQYSDRLQTYLAKSRKFEQLNIEGDIEKTTGHLIRRKMALRKRLRDEFKCPPEPWASVDAKLLWNITNIPASQISMLGKITGTCIAPSAACAGFVSALKLAENAIRLGEARAAVIGMTDPEPHPLSVGAFFGARVLAMDGQVSKPFTGLRGTHISGGACIWIVGDYDYFTGLGMKPLGLEILGIGLSSDAHHIITPNMDGPRRAIRIALDQAEAQPRDIATWDMHATATPGDWTELKNAMAFFTSDIFYTARKGSFGHGMSVCGGWELTAQHLGLVKGKVYPVDVQADEFHQMVQPFAPSMVQDEAVSMDGKLSGKINMGVGGINACAICRPWPGSG